MNDVNPTVGVERLIFSSHPVVTFANNQFVRVPTILQFDDTPLVSVVREEQLGFTSEIPIYHPDGTYLAKVRGVRVFPTEAGIKAGVSIRKLEGITVCELNGRTAFEIQHHGGDQFRVQAELHTPDGCFVRYADQPLPQVISASGQALRIGGMTMIGNAFVGCRIGVWVRSNGQVAIGVN